MLARYYASNIPPSLDYIYSLFLDFYNGEPFKYTEFNAWEQFKGLSLESHEKELIRDLSQIVYKLQISNSSED